MAMFAVKSLYTWKVDGEAVLNFEERVVLFKAKNFDAAIVKATKEAQRYCLTEFVNQQGKRVRFENLEYYNAFAIYDEIKEGCELFSNTTILNQRISPKKIVKKAIDMDQKISKREKDKLQKIFRSK